MGDLWTEVLCTIGNESGKGVRIYVFGERMMHSMSLHRSGTVKERFGSR